VTIFRREYGSIRKQACDKHISNAIFEHAGRGQEVREDCNGYACKAKLRLLGSTGSSIPNDFKALITARRVVSSIVGGDDTGSTPRHRGTGAWVGRGLWWKSRDVSKAGPKARGCRAGFAALRVLAATAGDQAGVRALIVGVRPANGAGVGSSPSVLPTEEGLVE
jgi:hypothetical protein